MVLNGFSTFYESKEILRFSLLFNQGEQLSECAPNAVGTSGTRLCESLKGREPPANSRRFIESDGWHDMA